MSTHQKEDTHPNACRLQPMSAATASSSVRLEDASQAHGLATRVAAAAAASAAAVVLVTPLDVIKVSMQAAFPSPHHG